MMKLGPARRKPRAENTIPLINIVFLLLVFFLVAGTLAPPADPQTSLILAPQSEPATPAASAALRADGVLYLSGEPVDEAAVVERARSALPAGQRETPGGAIAVALAVDRDAPARRLVEVAAALRQAGAAPVRIIVERAEP